MPELKWKDTNASGVSVTTTGIIEQEVAAIAQGGGADQKIGSKVTLRSWNLRFSFIQPAIQGGTVGQATAANTVRAILFIDRQTNGAAATVLDILEAQDEIAFNNLTNKHRFRILADKWIDFPNNGLVWNGTNYDKCGHRKTISFHKKFALPQMSDGPNAQIGDIQDYSLGFLIISNSTTLTYNWESRVRFSDA